MNTPPDLHPAVRIEGELIVITEDNVTLSPDEMVNILIELHRRGTDLKAACKEAGVPSFPAAKPRIKDHKVKRQLSGGDNRSTTE